MNPKKSTPRHILIKLSKVKDKEGIFFQRENFKSRKIKVTHHIKGIPNKTNSGLLIRNFTDQKGV